MISVREKLAQGVAALPINVDEDQVDKLDAYLALLQRWNKVHNLTAIRDESKMVTHHLLDSLSIARYVHKLDVIDVGTGGGLPGIPLAICLGEQHFTLLDSNSKKVSFLRQVCIELGLTNVTPVHARVEDFTDGLFDHVLCRAFASLDVIAIQLQHLLKAKGNILAMKSTEEMDTMIVDGKLKLAAVHRLAVPFLDADRCLVELSFG